MISKMKDWLTKRLGGLGSSIETGRWLECLVRSPLVASYQLQLLPDAKRVKQLVNIDQRLQRKGCNKAHNHHPMQISLKNVVNMLKLRFSSQKGEKFTKPNWEI